MGFFPLPLFSWKVFKTGLNIMIFSSSCDNWGKYSLWLCQSPKQIFPSLDDFAYCLLFVFFSLEVTFLRALTRNCIQIQKRWGRFSKRTGIYPFQPSAITTKLKSYAYISVPPPQPNKSWIPFLKIFGKGNGRSAPSLPLRLRSLSRDREQHLGVEGSCKIPTDGSHSEMLCKLDSRSAALAPLYNSPNQDLGSEIVECFENTELDSDADLYFLEVACLPSVCIWMPLRI